MAHSTSTFSLFPISPAAPGAFALFATSSNPRENHALYENIRVAFTKPAQRKRSASVSSIESLKEGLFKMFGAL
ncbi:hypothetical protein NEOLEDRAFT_1061817 [Neolentinus lepideus HHB14362 ss-1]|uniref:Uncharacterized protein n=1 Tax=Neolentinus lepideus HHB14362 ss-1 TaxID=1314782 RepID=A0A165TLX0_9AGAM|nr:hypothetical protein NEOLEDRAFT_1061817 [Neolentinus lepideus HHB14362 ss-1]